MTAGTVDVRPRRLVLAAAELELLRRLAGDLPLPADFSVGLAAARTGFGVESATLAAARSSLAGKGILSTSDSPLGTEPHPSVIANLQVLAGAEVMLQTRVQVDGTTIRAAHAVAGGLGASLARLGETASVELSLFPAERLGLELIRAVPPTGSPDRAGTRPAGRLPLAAIAEVGLAAEIGGDEVVRQLASELRLTASEQQLARALSTQAGGVLHCLITAPPRRAGEPPSVGQVLWYATPGGWVGLAPDPGTTPERRPVVLRPVEPVDIGAWVAPLVAGALAPTLAWGR
jgi:hypothetical protein